MTTTTKKPAYPVTEALEEAMASATYHLREALRAIEGIDPDEFGDALGHY